MQKRTKYNTYFTLKNGKGQSPILRFKQGEDIEKALARLRNKWIIDKFHQNRDQTAIHAGEVSAGETCQLCTKEKVPDETDNYFETIETPDDIIRCWKRSHNGLGIFYFMLSDESVADPVEYANSNGTMPFHMTIMYHPCGINEAICLYFWAREVYALFDGKTVIKIGSKNEKVVGKVKDAIVKMPGGVRPFIKNLSLRGWVPHVTDSENALKEGDYLVVKPHICHIRESNNNVSLFALGTYLDHLKHGAEGLEKYIQENKAKSAGYPELLKQG
jgi:hypothetical protein